MDHTIVCLQPQQRDAAATLLAQAFSRDPIYVALLPDPEVRTRSAELMFRGVLTYVLRYGEVWTTDKLWGVAAWLPPGKTKVTFWRMLRTGFALARGMRGYPPQPRRTLLRVFSRQDKEHAELVPEPHWYLWTLGVAPDRQGHGVGSALLRPVLARADAARVPCYLETETDYNVAFYRRRGFEVVRKAVAEEIGLPLWSMVRQPGA
ncbi:MAG: GNAT family N-acetyltransferase [Anaerolineae bacterium]|nr:GNAT family N-acetyltransferase [Anaerolineae bacterium]